jgi:putative component of membrane protein insertase Oxa1/YidC/SpoIIIJ protein YidD
VSTRRPSAASRFALRFIATYQQEVAPRGRHRCGSTPSCSEYGEIAYRSHGVVRATILVVAHLARCRPPAHSAPSDAGEQRAL